MAEAVVLTAHGRGAEQLGSRAASKLRKKGLIPAVMYGHQEANANLAIPRDDFTRAIRHGTRLLDIQQGANVQKALVKEVQWDALGSEVLHVDLARVSADERVEVDVRVELRGVAPGIAAGGALNQPLHSLHIECPVISLPESIRVAVGTLQLGQAIHVKELQLPPGVVCKNDPDAIVVQVVAKTEEEVKPAGEQAEPEVIGRKVEADADEE